MADGGLLSDMRYDVHGGGSEPLLLLVHGFLSSRGQWRANIEALAEACTPVTVELLGHGRSGAPTDPQAYSVAAYVRRFEALRQRLGVDRWFICGQSFGAGLTVRYALEHPQRIIGQIFTNSLSGLSQMRGDPGHRDGRAAVLERGGHEALRALPFYPRPSRRLARHLWEDMVRDAALLSPAGVAEAMRTTVPDLSVIADLPEIRVPTLLVNGAREAAFQPLRDHAVRAIPGVEVVDLEGGHSVNIDSAGGFNEAVAAFVRRLS